MAQRENCVRDYDHASHYLGRNALGMHERCEGSTADEDYEDLGWTGL